MWFRSSPGRRVVRGVAGVALAGAVALLAPVPASAAEAGPVTVEGKVGCLNELAPVGIWVEADDGGSGFADWEVRAEEGLAGFGYAYYSFVLPHGGSYRLNVGCGGTSDDWRMTARTPTVSGTGHSFTCNDIDMVLETAGKWAFSRSLGRWVKALDFTRGIENGRCAEL